MRPTSGAPTVATGRTPLAGDDISPRNVANPLNGKDKTVTSVNVSHLETAVRLNDDRIKRATFMISPNRQKETLNVE